MHRTRTTITALVLTTLAGTTFAGPLAPPTGPITSTMKTMAEVEPRTAINAVNTPGSATSRFKITQPGSYYLTDHITHTTTGIEIAASNVTIDLNGFTISGGTHAIESTISVAGIVVKNGFVKSTTSTGIRLFSASKGLIEGVQLSNVSGSGFATGGAFVLRNCVASQSGSGFSAGGACTFDRCFADTCETGFGLDVSCILTNCSATNCTDTGFESLSSGVRLENCTAVNCTNFGFKFTSGVTIERCTARTSGRGFDIGDNSTLTNSAALANIGQGARAGATCSVVSNTFRLNGAASDSAGLWIQGNGNRVENNEMTGNDWGLWVDGTDNIIIRNTARGNTAANYGTIAAGNEMAPVIVGPGNFAAATYFSNFAH